MKLVIQKCAVIFILLLQISLSYGAVKGYCTYEPGNGFVPPRGLPEETLTIKNIKYWCCANTYWNNPYLNKGTPLPEGGKSLPYDCRQLVKEKLCVSVGAHNSSGCDKNTKKFGE